MAHSSAARTPGARTPAAAQTPSAQTPSAQTPSAQTPAAQTPAVHSGPGRIHYGGRRFRPAGAVPADGAAAPVGEYHQDGDLVWAEFSGAGIRVGRLVGTCRPDGVIDAAYCLVTAAGETAAGACVSTPSTLADGRLRLTEQWRRLDGSSGVSHIEEIVE
jgi:hypothetical protein